MKKVTLTKEQINLLKKNLADVHDMQNGEFDVDIVIDYLLTINVQGWLETDGYREDDYLNGTGAYVETYRNADVHLTAIMFNIEACENEVREVDEVTAREIGNFLNAA